MSDDMAVFRELSTALADGIEEHLCGWTEHNVVRIATAAGIADDDTLRSLALRAGQRCRDEVGPRVRELLEMDIDDQRSTPLVLLRGAVSHATDALSSLGVPEVRRDEFERRAFPDDLYGLSPATMSDLDESLGELALMWGAGKAHMHKRRHM